MWWNLVVTRPEVREGPEMEKSMLWKDHLLSWQFAICNVKSMQKCPNLQDSNLSQKSWSNIWYNDDLSYLFCRVGWTALQRELTLNHVFQIRELRFAWLVPLAHQLAKRFGHLRACNEVLCCEKQRSLREMKHLQTKHPLLFFLAKGRTWQKSRKQWQRTLLYFLDTVMQKIETEVSDWQTNGSSVCRCYGQSWGSSEMLRTTPRGGSRHLQPKYAYCQCNFRRIWEGMIFDVEVCKNYQMVVYIWCYIFHIACLFCMHVSTCWHNEF